MSAPHEPDVAAGVTSGAIHRATAGVVGALKRRHHALHMPAPFNSAIKGASCRARSITALMTCTECGGASGEQHRAAVEENGSGHETGVPFSRYLRYSQELNNAKLGPVFSYWSFTRERIRIKRRTPCTWRKVRIPKSAIE
jgi:hypothetical protein